MSATSIVRDLHWTPFFTLFRREILRFTKVIAQTVITPLVNASLYLLIFGVSLGPRIDVKSGTTYLAFLIPGLVMLGALNNAFQNSASSIIAGKFSGDLEDLKVAPMSSLQIILAFGLAAVVRGMLVGLVTFAVGEACYLWVYGQFLPIAHLHYLFVFLILGCMSFANLGVMAAFWARTFDQLSAISGFILLPLLYLGGVFFSVQNLPSFWQHVAEWNPLLYMINGTRYGMLGAADVEPLMALTISFAAFLLTLALALRTIRRASFQRW